MSKTKPHIGMITESWNFILRKKIETLQEFWDALESEKSIFCRHRMYPTAFFYSWHLRQCHMWIWRGDFFICSKVNPYNKWLINLNQLKDALIDFSKLCAKIPINFKK